VCTLERTCAGTHTHTHTNTHTHICDHMCSHISEHICTCTHIYAHKYSDYGISTEISITSVIHLFRTGYWLWEINAWTTEEQVKGTSDYRVREKMCRSLNDRFGFQWNHRGPSRRNEVIFAEGCSTMVSVWVGPYSIITRLAAWLLCLCQGLTIIIVMTLFLYVSSIFDKRLVINGKVINWML